MKKNTWLYLLFAFGIAWLLWCAMFGMAAVSGQVSPTLQTLLNSLGMFAPLLAVLLLGLLHKDFFAVSLRPKIRGNVRFYLAALLLPSLFTVLGGVLYFLVFLGQFDPAMTAVTATMPPEQNLPLLFALQLLSAALIAPFFNMLFAFGEEAGWRGYLYPALEKRFGTVGAVVLGGIIWGLWHTPLLLNGHNYGTNYWGYPVLGIVAMCFFCISSGCLLQYLTFKTGSVWPAALCHGAINAIAGLPVLFLPLGAQPNALLGPSLVGALVCAPLAVFSAFLAWRMVRCAQSKA